MTLHTYSLRKLSKMLNDRSLSTKELAEHYIARIAKFNTSLNAILNYNEENVLIQAQKAQEMIDNGTNTPITGIPIAHKDIFCTTELPTTCGSKTLESFISPYNATIVDKLTKQGVVTLGKTNMDEFAMGSSNENSAFGPCFNPWNNSRVPGGSSGGSAVAVSARIAPCSTGSDTGGSIRQPAAFCGITGLKPTYGRVSRYGMIAYASSLDQAGPMAQSAYDCALLMNALAGHDENDSTTNRVEVPNYIKNLDKPLDKMIIGIPNQLFNDDTPKSVVHVLQNFRDALQSLGVTFKEISMPNFDYSVPTYYTIACCEASSNLSRYDGIRFGHRAAAENLNDLYGESRDQGFGDEVKRRILLGTFALSKGYSDDYYEKARKIRQVIRMDFMKAYTEVDLILAPTTASPAFKINEKIKDPIKMYYNDYYTISANLAGLPAASIPVGFFEEMPMGFQLIGDRFREERILHVAHQYQSITDWHTKIPEPYQE